MYTCKGLSRHFSVSKNLSERNQVLPDLNWECSTHSTRSDAIKTLLFYSLAMATGVVFDQSFVSYNCLWDGNHAEKPEKYEFAKLRRDGIILEI